MKRQHPLLFLLLIIYHNIHIRTYILIDKADYIYEILIILISSSKCSLDNQNIQTLGDINKIFKSDLKYNLDSKVRIFHTITHSHLIISAGVSLFIGFVLQQSVFFCKFLKQCVSTLFPTENLSNSFCWSTSDSYYYNLH